MGTFADGASYSIDGGVPFVNHTLELQTDPRLYTAPLFSTDQLARGEHTLTIVNLNSTYTIVYFKVDSAVASTAAPSDSHASGISSASTVTSSSEVPHGGAEATGIGVSVSVKRPMGVPKFVGGVVAAVLVIIGAGVYVWWRRKPPPFHICAWTYTSGRFALSISYPAQHFLT